MAASGTEIKASGQVPDPPAERRRRRSPLSRWSAGHWTMVLAGVLAGLVNYTLLTGDDPPVTVGVAAVDLEPGERLRLDRLTFVETGLEDPGEHGLILEAEAAGLVGRIIVRRVAAGELLAESALRGDSTRVLRTMSIPIDPSHAVGGHLRPGDRVDVIVTDDGVALYVATDVQVVRVADRGGGGALGGLSPFSVTVAVDGESVLLIAAAMRSGDIEIVRSNGASPAPDERWRPPSEDRVRPTPTAQSEAAEPPREPESGGGSGEDRVP